MASYYFETLVEPQPLIKVSHDNAACVVNVGDTLVLNSLLKAPDRYDGTSTTTVTIPLGNTPQPGTSSVSGWNDDNGILTYSYKFNGPTGNRKERRKWKSKRGRKNAFG